MFQIPAGLLSLKFGGCRVFGYSVFVASLINLIMPMLTRQGVVNLIALRALQGLLLVSDAVKHYTGDTTHALNCTGL